MKMESRKPMRSKKRWIISGAAAVLLAAGGVSMLSGSEPAPLTHEEILKKSEDKFGKPTQPPTVEELKDQLAQVQATAPATVPATAPATAPATTQEDLQKAPDDLLKDLPKTQDDWQKAELLKQQIVFAEHAPSPMPTGHSSYVVSGKQP
jgi:hypothetical protein